MKNFSLRTVVVALSFVLTSAAGFWDSGDLIIEAVKTGISLSETGKL